jgi:hypothetical protein
MIDRKDFVSHLDKMEADMISTATLHFTSLKYTGGFSTRVAAAMAASLALQSEAHIYGQQYAKDPNSSSAYLERHAGVMKFLAETLAPMMETEVAELRATQDKDAK